MMDFKTLMQRAHATSLAHGWYTEPDGSTLQLMTECDGVTTPNVRAILERHALIHSELSEAWAEWQCGQYHARSEGGKPEGFVVELADVVIRIADLLSCWRVEHDPLSGVDPDYSYLYGFGRETDRSIVDNVRSLVDDATEAIREGRLESWSFILTDCVEHIVAMCAALDLDLQGALDTKLKYNETRPYRHGGKLA